MIEGEKSMKIKIFGFGCAKCKEVESLVGEAVREAGLDASIEKASDFVAMMASGIASTPAVEIDGNVVCTGRVPGKAELLKWLRDGRAGVPADGQKQCSCKCCR